VNDLTTTVLSTKLINGNNLQVIIQTKFYSTSGYLVSPVATQVPWTFLSIVEGPAQKQCLASSVAGVCIQQWTLQTGIGTQFTGTYGITWTVASCLSPTNCVPTANAVFSSFVINMNVIQTTVLNTNFQTVLTTYNDPFLTPFSGPFGTNGIMYLKNQLTVAAADVNSFNIVFNNVWICYSNSPSFVPTWNPSAGQYGCSISSANVPTTNILQIISNQQVMQTTQILSALNPTVYPSGSSQLPYKTTIGFSVDTQPLAFQTGIYYIHVETVVSPAKRKGQSSTPTRMVQLSVFYVNSQSTTSNTTVVKLSSANSHNVALSFAILMVIVMFILLN